MNTYQHSIQDILAWHNTTGTLTQRDDYPFNKIYTKRSRSIETITEGDYELTYTYGTDQQRKKSALNNTSTGAVEKTIYYAGNYEEITVGTDVYEVHYISSLTGLTAIYVDHNGTGTLYYVYTDHLGSILTLTDASGTVVYEQNFDAWGRERNPTDWSYTANTGTKPAWLVRGFTGHEHLPQFALINMNGRCYDPVLGRMLSPDNYVQSPGYSQGLNRYSYALNNPLVFTDPSGELIPVWIIPNISFSPNGGLTISVTVGVGMSGLAFAGVTVGGSTDDSYFVSAGGNLGIANASIGWHSTAGFNASLGLGIPQTGIPIGNNFAVNSNITNIGISYSQYGGLL